MRRLLKHPILNSAMAGIAVLAGVLSYNVMDTAPPSFVIAMWPSPYELAIGEKFIVTEIFVRNRRCARFVSQGFSQEGIGHPILDDPPSVLFPRAVGLITQKFEAVVPGTLALGPAEYRMSITWICPLHPRTWFGGVYVILPYSVTIIKDKTKACSPGETTLQVPGAEIQLKCRAKQSDGSDPLKKLADGLH